MQYALIGVVAVLTIVAVSAFAKQLAVAAPLVLVLVGIGYSYLPGVPEVSLPPWMLLAIALPPILYASAVRVPLVDFRRSIGSIFTLSVLLVVGTAVIVGVLVDLALPSLGIANAIALGAIISPTDAVAATTVAKRLGLPARLITILEGESLVNDASSLVLLKAAVGASAASISLWNVAGNFAYSVVVALAAGLIVGVVSVFARSKLTDPMLDTVISFAVPFIAYLPAEELGASGLLAVVVAGLYSGHTGARRFSAQARINERANWRTIQYLLENGVFLVMGVQLKAVIGEVPPNEFGVFPSVGLGLLLCVLLLGIRVAFVIPLLWQLRRARRKARPAGERVDAGLRRIRRRDRPADERGKRRLAKAEHMLRRRSADLADLRGADTGWRGGVIVSWAGMRGVVTLAAAQSLPVDTPLRPQLILIAFTVAVTTLLVEGGTLPLVIRLTGIRGTDADADRRELATLLDEISNAATALLEHPDLQLPEGEEVDPEVVERVRRDTLLRSEALWERVERASDDNDLLHGPHGQYRSLRAQALQAEREALLEARSTGSYPSRVLSRAQAMLDLEEARLAQTGGPG